jgi:hypothetical protein
MIYPRLTNYLSVISRYRLYQILSYLLHENVPSNFVVPNFVKNFRKSLKNTESTKNLTSYSQTSILRGGRGYRILKNNPRITEVRVVRRSIKVYHLIQVMEKQMPSCHSS